MSLKFGTTLTKIKISILLILFPAICYSAGTISSVSGTISDGESITISGSSFGSAPNVVLFDDFESGSNGNNIATGAGSAKYGQWDDRDSGGSSYYSNANKVSGSLAFASNYLNHYSNWIQTNLPEGTTDAFFSWWLFLPSDDNYPGEGGDGINWKQMWIQGESTSDDDLVTPTRLAGGWQVNGNDNPYSESITVAFAKGTWSRWWVWIKGSSTGTAADGEFYFWELSGSGVLTRKNDTSVNTLNTGGEFERLRPNGFGNQASNCIAFFDDIYVATGANAQARVEIGDNSTYSSCTDLTILTPTSWAASSISATVNLGRFSSGTAYIFVIDSDGDASSGYEITIGSTNGSAKSTASGSFNLH